MSSRRRVLASSSAGSHAPGAAVIGSRVVDGLDNSMEPVDGALPPANSDADSAVMV